MVNYQAPLRDLNAAGAVATDYLRLFGLVALGYMWARMAARGARKTRRRRCWLLRGQDQDGAILHAMAFAADQRRVYRYHGRRQIDHGV